MFFRGDTVQFTHKEEDDKVVPFRREEPLVSSFRVGTVVEVTDSELIVMDTPEKGEPFVSISLPEFAEGQTADVTFRKIFSYSAKPADSSMFAGATQEDMRAVSLAHEAFIAKYENS